MGFRVVICELAGGTEKDSLYCLWVHPNPQWQVFHLTLEQALVRWAYVVCMPSKEDPARTSLGHGSGHTHVTIFLLFSVLISATTCLLCELHLTLWSEAMGPAAVIGVFRLTMDLFKWGPLNKSPHSSLLHPSTHSRPQLNTTPLAFPLKSCLPIELIALGYVCKNTPSLLRFTIIIVKLKFKILCHCMLEVHNSLFDFIAV